MTAPVAKPMPLSSKPQRRYDTASRATRVAVMLSDEELEQLDELVRALHSTRAATLREAIRQMHAREFLDEYLSKD